MATLDNKKILKKRRMIRTVIGGILSVAVLLGPYFAYLGDQIMKSFVLSLSGQKGEINFDVVNGYRVFLRADERILRIYVIVLLLATVFVIWILLIPGSTLTKTDTVQITDDIEIPVAVGNGQFGNARFLTYDEVKDNPDVSAYVWGDEWKGGKAGIVFASRTIHGKEEWLFDAEDKHSMNIGPTRSGKNRRLLFRSIVLAVIAGENDLVFDAKGENWTYTHLFARSRGFTDYALDLREPEKGVHYNFLQPILDAIELGDIATAIDSTWDLVAQLVNETKGERIWYNGECAAIAASVLIVALEAPEKYRNMTNVYYFLAFMCKPDAFGGMPFNAYLDELPDTHPAKGVFAMASIAHEKTRGSFFSSALGTLKHFTNPKIAEMSSYSDFRIQDLVNQKSIIYLIVPDEKTTLYPVATLFMDQLSTVLSREAINNGGRLPIDWNIWADEFGQYPCMPNLPASVSVQAGRGVRWHFFIQSYQQMEDKYEKRSEIIKDNCLTTIFLKSTSPKTNKEVSERLGKYTVQVKSVSSSVTDAKRSSINYSNSSNMQARDLLTADEVGRIKSPYLIYMNAGYFPAVLKLPDMGESKLNATLGMGDKEHNRLLTLERAKERVPRKIGELELWGIWNQYQLSIGNDIDEDVEDEAVFSENSETTSRISFL